MSARITLMLCAAVMAAGLAGCVTGKKDTTGFAIEQEVVLDKPYADAWQHVKRTLLANEYELYTRDKRGTFVAYTGGKAFLGVLNSPRTRYTLDLESLSNAQTKVNIQAVKQVYGTSLTTYPDWHDRKNNDAESVEELVAALQGATPPEATAMPSEAETMPDAPPADEDAAPAPAPAPEPIEEADPAL